MTETNHPIAEQDSLERLIAALRKKAVCVYLATEGSVAKDIADSMNEAADTLSQMREALERAGRALEIYGDDEEVEAILAVIGKESA